MTSAQCLWSSSMRTRWVLHHTSRSIKETLWLWALTVNIHRKTVLLSCPQCKEQYEKVLEDVSAYTPRYMEEMESIFEQSQEEERRRISFLKQAFLSIHRHLDVTNNERWAALSDCSNVTYWGFIIHELLFAQCESCVQWPPPNPDVHQWARGSQMVEEQSRPRHAYWLAEGWGVFNTFSAQTRCHLQTANINIVFILCGYVRIGSHL